jgi:hypothetical protein
MAQLQTSLGHGAEVVSKPAAAPGS